MLKPGRMVLYNSSTSGLPLSMGSHDPTCQFSEAWACTAARKIQTLISWASWKRWMLRYHPAASWIRQRYCQLHKSGETLLLVNWAGDFIYLFHSIWILPSPQAGSGSEFSYFMNQAKLCWFGELSSFPNSLLRCTQFKMQILDWNQLWIGRD